MSKKPRSLETFVEDKTQARFSENQELARTARAARAEAREKDEQLAEVRKRLAIYEQLDAARLEPPEWLTPKTPSAGHRAIPSLVITDWHWGEVVRPEEVNGINCYNVRIAEQRLRRAFEGAVTICRDYLKGVTYDGFQVFMCGDLISGQPHAEIRETNEQTVAETVVAIVEPLEAGLNLLAKEFGKVHVVGVPGNHPRSTPKQIAKRRAADNYDTLVYRLLARDYRNDARITVDASEAVDARVTLYNTRYLATHGSDFVGGSGISGALAPLLLGAHRTTRQQAAAGTPYDQLVLGHFHQSLWFPSKGIIVSGCGIGYNEFAHARKYEPEPPQAIMWLTTPQRGITVSAPVFVQERRQEGW